MMILMLRDRNDAIIRVRQDGPAVERDTENPPKHRPARRRRWGGRLFALGGFLSLAGGVSLGAWGQYSQQQQVMATAEQERDFVPSVRVATVEAAPAPCRSPCRARPPHSRGEHLCPRDRLYRQAQRRHRGPGQDRASCWRSWRCRRSMTRFRKTRRRSFSSSRPWSRRRPT